MTTRSKFAWIVVDPALITLEMINCIKVTMSFESVSLLSKNVAGDRVWLRFNMEQNTVFLSFPWLTHAEMLIEKAKPEWTIPDSVNDLVGQ